MQYTQSKLATKIELNFEEEELEYSMQDNTSDLNFEVAYHKLPKRSQTFKERNEWLRNVGYIWLALGIFFTIVNIADGTIRVNFWIYVGLICLAVYRYTWADYTYFDTDEGRILVLKDSQSEEIMNELKSRRRAAFLSWFDKLEFETDGQLEGTLDYLVKEKIYTRDEANAKLETIKSGKHLRLVSSVDDPPNLLQ
jgi:hypothetical protein